MEKTIVNKSQLDAVIEEKVTDVTKGLAEQVEALSNNVSHMNKREVSEKENAKRFAALTGAILTAEKEINDGAISVNQKSARVLEIIKERYETKNPEFVAEVTRNKDLMATGNGGLTIKEEYAAGFLHELQEATVMGRLGVKFTPTSTGNLTYNKIVSGVAAGYVSELGTIPTSTIKFGRIRLSVKKLMALVPVSNDLIRYSSLNIQSLINSELIGEMAAAQDTAFFYGKGGEWEPRGLATIEDAVDAGTIVASSEAIEGLKATLGAKNHDIRGAKIVMGWKSYLKFLLEKQSDIGYVNKAEMAQGKLAGLEYIVTNRVKLEGDLEDMFLVIPNSIVGIEGVGVSIQASQSATIQFGNDVMNTFTNDFTLVRAIAEHDWAPVRSDVFVKAKVNVA